jgi:hypothetical protein
VVKPVSKLQRRPVAQDLIEFAHKVRIKGLFKYEIIFKRRKLNPARFMAKEMCTISSRSLYK